MILIYFVLVLLSNSHAAASSRLEHDLAFMHAGFVMSSFIITVSAQRLFGIFGPTSG